MVGKAGLWMAMALRPLDDIPQLMRVLLGMHFTASDEIDTKLTKLWWNHRHIFDEEDRITVMNLLRLMKLFLHHG